MYNMRKRILLIYGDEKDMMIQIVFLVSFNTISGISILLKGDNARLIAMTGHTIIS